MWLLNEENELINLTAFVALRLEPVPDSENHFCLVGVVGGDDEGGETDDEQDGEGDESFVQLSPPLPKAAADALFHATIAKLAPVRVREFMTPVARPQRPQGPPVRPRPERRPR